MTAELSSLLGHLLRAGGFLLVLNEIRGLVMAGPVLWALVQAGCTLAAVYAAVCSLLGILASVLIPLFGLRKLDKMRLRAISQA
ncbi:hypothetical protein [Tsuneonella troitsensis]|uniref:hypothetical protein n=1 Tax=Tsuneonella troitsensis TaxID=292222 RepID=UPI00070C411A|nr:hypothetical protein [Tsuneonella troitsensis]